MPSHHRHRHRHHRKHHHHNEEATVNGDWYLDNAEPFYGTIPVGTISGSVLRGHVLTTPNGKKTELMQLTSTTFGMWFHGMKCHGELREDGKLHWRPSGDVWKKKQGKSEGEENKWSRIFHAADEDGDGKLDKREFRHLMQHLGSQMSKEEMYQCFTLADKNNSGQVRFSEFVVWAMEVQDAEGSIKDGGGDGRYRDGYPPSEGCGSLYSFFDMDFEPRRSVHRSVQKFDALSEEQLHYVEARAAQMAHVNRWMPAELAEAILVWTMECPIYKKITTMARIYDSESEDWFERHEDYCYYLDRALDRIPNHEGVVYRHVPVVVHESDYPAGRSCCWPGPNSASTEPQKSFLKDEGRDAKGKRKLSGTLFMLMSRFGKDISPFSYFNSEKEVLFSFNSIWCVDLFHREGRNFSRREWLAEHLDPYFEGYNWSGVCIVVMTQITDDEFLEHST